MTDSTRPVFVLYTAATNHANIQPGTWGAKFFRDHVDNRQWGCSSSYWMVPGHTHGELGDSKG